MKILSKFHVILAGALLSFSVLPVAIAQQSEIDSVEEESDGLSPAGRKALAELLSATQLQSEYIGFAAQPSPYISNLRVVLREVKQTGNASAFYRLEKVGSLEAKVYALIGLYLSDRKGFFEVYDRLKQYPASTTIRSMTGCIIGELPLADAIHHIARAGKYPLSGRGLEEIFVTW